MRKLLILAIPAALALLSGCVVAPAGRGYYYGPHVAVVAGPAFYGRGWYYRSRW